MPYFQMESSTSLQEQHLIPIAFVRTAMQYKQVTTHKAVLELAATMDSPSKTLTNYRQKISVKKSAFAPARIKLTELNFAEYDAATVDIVASAPPRVSDDRSRSPRLALARRTPIETVREQLNLMTQGDLHQIMALCASRFRRGVPVISAESTLLADKREVQLQLLEAPWTERASILEPFVARIKSQPGFNEMDMMCDDLVVMRADHEKIGLTFPIVQPDFQRAMDFVYNWPPHDMGFKQTRDTSLDPQIYMEDWRKIRTRAMNAYAVASKQMFENDEKVRVPADIQTAFVAEVRFTDINGNVSDLISINGRVSKFRESMRLELELSDSMALLRVRESESKKRAEYTRFDREAKEVDMDMEVDVTEQPMTLDKFLFMNPSRP